MAITYIYQSIPTLPEITVGNHTDRLTKLGSDRRRNRNHQSDQLTLDGRNLIQRQLVFAIFICPAALNEVLEAQSARKAEVARVRIGCGNMEKL